MKHHLGVRDGNGLSLYQRNKLGLRFTLQPDQNLHTTARLPYLHHTTLSRELRCDDPSILTERNPGYIVARLISKTSFDSAGFAIATQEVFYTTPE